MNHQRNQGFTITEAAMSTAIFAVLLASTATMTSTSINVMSEAAEEGREDVEELRTENGLDTWLLAASVTTLKAIPPGGQVEETMEEGVAYDNLSFRRVIGIEGDAAKYQPDKSQAAYQIYVLDGKLVLDQGKTTVDLQSGVASVQFMRREGAPRCIDVTINSSDYGSDDYHNGQYRGSSTALSFILMTP